MEVKAEAWWVEFSLDTDYGLRTLSDRRWITGYGWREA